MTLYPTTKKPVAEYELDEQDNLLMDIVGGIVPKILKLCEGGNL